MEERRLAVLGAGTIGESLIAGLLSSGWRDRRIVATGRREERLEELADRHGVQTTLSNTEAVANAAIVVIAVKPQDFAVLLGEIGQVLQPEQTVLSVAAAIPTALIESRVTAGVPVVRAMPNAPRLVHEGIAGVCAGAHADDQHLELAEEVLSHLGARRPRSRELHGRGNGRLRLRPGLLRPPGRGDDRGWDPARALPPDLDRPRHPDDARHGQASPGREDAPGGAARGGHLSGGTTIRAIRELERAGVRAAFLNAIQAAMERSRELAAGEL